MIMAPHFPELIIIIKNSKIAPKVQTHFTFKHSADSLTSSVFFISKLLIFLIPSKSWQRKGRGWNNLSKL